MLTEDQDRRERLGTEKQVLTHMSIQWWLSDFSMNILREYSVGSLVLRLIRNVMRPSSMRLLSLSLYARTELRGVTKSSSFIKNAYDPKVVGNSVIVFGEVVYFSTVKNIWFFKGRIGALFSNQIQVFLGAARQSLPDLLPIKPRVSISRRPTAGDQKGISINIDSAPHQRNTLPLAAHMPTNSSHRQIEWVQLPELLLSSLKGLGWKHAQPCCR